jgi:2-desacetyl-2-hydroxyethyl bacteriochlorophyllide A dehydrogenase
VLVRVTHSGICGTDLKIFTGAIPVSYPLIMGHEMSGEVVEGYDGDRLKRGDRVVVDPVVYCGVCVNCRAGQTNLCPNGVLLGRDANGGFAEYVSAPRSHVFRLPETIDPRTAPAIQVLTTCVHAQRRTRIFPGQSVVVVGLGVTGQLHVQLAKARGAHPVIGITRSAWKRDLAEQLGADITLPAGEDTVRRVIEATHGRGADVVIESTGIVRSLADSITMARLGGTLLLFGITTVTEGALPFYQLYFKELTMVNARAAKGEDFPDSIDLVARGVVKLLPLVTQVMPVSDLGPAIDMLKTDVDGRMKIILEH